MLVSSAMSKILLDGKHRHLAHRQANVSTIKAKILWTSDDNDAYERAVELNSRHAKQLTQDEKRHAGQRMFRAGVPVEKIAQLLGVDARTVYIWTERASTLGEIKTGRLKRYTVKATHRRKSLAASAVASTVQQ